jgi:hypothetical protein
MNEALSQLRKIAKITDQKHWNCTEMRERALENWINHWIIQLNKEQLILNTKDLPINFEDLIKERLFTNMLDDIMTEAAVITKEPNKIKGELLCIRRKAKS